MNYKESIAYLNGFLNFERSPEDRFETSESDLERFRTLLHFIGNPQNDYPIIHIAGTKGKGSTAAILSSVLERVGYKVGLYTSPHLITIRERIKVNNRSINKSAFASTVEEISNIPVEIRLGERIAFRTVFEHLTAIALRYFSKAKTDVAIIETGLGGRLDSTVVVDPIISVITPIGLDHTAILGDTIRQISYEKSFIIKPNTPVVISPQKMEALDVLLSRARDVHADYIIAPGKKEFDNICSDLEGISFMSSRKEINGKKIVLGLRGDFQLENASTVLSILETIAEKGFKVLPSAILEGFKIAKWEGRMQVLLGERLTLVDGAHNPLAVTTVLKSWSAILENFSYKSSFRTIFGSHKNKNYLEMIDELKPVTQKFYFTEIQFPKSLDYDQLSLLSETSEVPSEVFRNLKEAYSKALTESATDEIILVIGSLYLAGELLRIKKGIPSPRSDGRIDDLV